MTSNINLRGVGVALITPFTDSGAVDFEALTDLIHHVTAGGVDYLVVLGTTAEVATLSREERRQVFAHVCQNNHAKLPLVAGIGGNNTAEVIETIQTTDLARYSAILSVTPYYNKPNQAGLYAHFAAILEASPLPVILYNVPGRTGINMSASTTISLARNYPGRAVAIKEASGNMSQVAYMLRDRPEGFLVLSGDDNMTLPTVALGGDGVISVSANAFTERFCAMVHSALEGDFARASKLNLELHAITDMLFEEGNPAGIKAALAIKGIVKNRLRLPLVESTDQLYIKLEREIEKMKL